MTRLENESLRMLVMSCSALLRLGVAMNASLLLSLLCPSWSFRSLRPGSVIRCQGRRSSVLLPLVAELQLVLLPRRLIVLQICFDCRSFCSRSPEIAANPSIKKSQIHWWSPLQAVEKSRRTRSGPQKPLKIKKKSGVGDIALTDRIMESRKT